jgi:hypothetical protein
LLLEVGWVSFVLFFRTGVVLGYDEVFWAVP